MIKWHEVLEQTKIRVLLAEDSMLMRVLIKDILAEDPAFEVVGVVNNGYDAFVSTQQLRPDVVLMDLVMGEYSGLYGIEKIMKNCPTPIIVLSAVGNTDMNQIMKALALGAVDYLNKPAKHSTDLMLIGDQLQEKLKAAKMAYPNPVYSKDNTPNLHAHSFDGQLPYDVILIGASTGGPTALEQIILNLPANLPVPVLVVQHMPDHFLPSFVERLNRLTPLDLHLAQQAEVLKPEGGIILMRAHANTCLKQDKEGVKIQFTNQRFEAYNFPSVDALFLSAAEIYKNRAIGVLLTGMGRDGTAGMQALYEAGAYTIAQSEESCVVYGMPKNAFEAGVVKQVVHLKDIGGFLVSCLS